MVMGRRRKEKQPELFIAQHALPQSPGHVFYDKLNDLLAEARFDALVEKLCEPYYDPQVGRPSLPPGVYFRMLFVGYFENIASQRGIAWRCSDSRSLQSFLGYLPTEATPDHSSLTNLRLRLSEAVHDTVFAFVLQLAEQKGLQIGKSVGVDATTLEAHAAMKTLQRRDSGEDYQDFTRRLAQEAGLENPSDAEVRRFDKKRKDKKMSNEEWQSPSDPDSQITKMKDGTTHLAYKAEHVVDLQSELVLSAQILPATTADSASLPGSVLSAEISLAQAESEVQIKEVVTDKGYHKIETLEQMQDAGYRTYTPEPEQPHQHTWTDKPAQQERAYRNNRRRVRGQHGRNLQRQRSEKVERSFAHVCDTGGGRRSWLRGLVNVSKRYLIIVAAYNLSIVMRKLFRVGKPRVLQGAREAFTWVFLAALRHFLHTLLGLRYRVAL